MQPFNSCCQGQLLQAASVLTLCHMIANNVTVAIAIKHYTKTN